MFLDLLKHFVDGVGESGLGSSIRTSLSYYSVTLFESTYS